MARTRVYIGLGSNIDSEQMIARAVRSLEERFELVRVAPIYSNSAIGFEGDDFLNTVVRFETSIQLSALREIFYQIEAGCGRNRASEEGKGARTMDIDLLLYGELEGSIDGYQLPRPDVFNRCFVWQPLLDLWNRPAPESLEANITELATTEFEQRIKNRLIKIANTETHDMRVIDDNYPRQSQFKS